MEKAAYINSVSAYLPNSPIANEDMEDYIGKIGGNPSRVRSIVLRQKWSFLSKYNNISRHITNRRHCKQMYGMSIFIIR